MKNEVKIGFVGFGNMARAMAKGLLKMDVCQGNQIFACAGHYDRLQKNAELLGVQAVRTAAEVVEKSDYVILAVKPNMIESVVEPIVDLLQKKVVISVAAGFDFERYEKILKTGTHHISTVPNTPISVGEGIMVCEDRHSLSPMELEDFVRIFSNVALVEMVKPEQLSIAGTLSGCSPAFTAMYLEALADAGVKHGLTRDAAYRMAAKMICGTGKLYLENENHPGVMKDAVCSPGGTTIRGVASLEKDGFRGAVIGAIDAIEG